MSLMSFEAHEIKSISIKKYTQNNDNDRALFDIGIVLDYFRGR